jgi:hypothetical protein
MYVWGGVGEEQTNAGQRSLESICPCQLGGLKGAGTALGAGTVLDGYRVGHVPL